MPNYLNKTSWTIQLRKGLAANLAKVTTYLLEGEIVYVTDTKKVWIGDGTWKYRVHGLDMVVVSDGNIITNAGEIVWQS